MSIEDAATEAVALARRIGCLVRFRFNGVECIAHAHDSPREIAHRQQHAQARGYTHMNQGPPVQQPYETYGGRRRG